MTQAPRWRPPDRDGVSASPVVVTRGPWTTVAGFLAARLRPGIDWPARLARGEVLADDGRALHPEAPCRPGQRLWYWRELPDEPAVPFDMPLLHVDADLVVVDKPHFLAAVPGGRFLRETALVRAKRALGNADLMPLHRLDRETAGVMMLSARPATRDAYHALLRERRVHKVYEAVAPWRDDLALPLRALHRLENVADGPHLPVRVLPGEPNADTGVELLRRLPGGLALYRLTPRTGRRHQLRAQMNALGVPIVGDRMYPRLWPEDAPGQPPDFTQPLQLLARELVFDDPVSGAPRRFASTRRLALAGDG